MIVQPNDEWVKSSKNAAVQIRCEGLGGITFVFSGEMHLHEVCISRDKFIQNMYNENNMDLSLTFVWTCIWLKNEVEINFKSKGMVSLLLENASIPFKQFKHLVFLVHHFVLRGGNCFILLYPVGLANSETSIISSLLYYLFPFSGDGLPSNQWFYLNLLPCPISE